MDRLPNGIKVYILGKTIGGPFESTDIYHMGQDYGYIRGWKDGMDCYIVRYDEGEEVRGDYFKPEDITVSVNKGRA